MPDTIQITGELQTTPEADRALAYAFSLMCAPAFYALAKMPAAEIVEVTRVLEEIDTVLRDPSDTLTLALLSAAKAHAEFVTALVSGVRSQKWLGVSGLLSENINAVRAGDDVHVDLDTAISVWRRLKTAANDMLGVGVAVPTVSTVSLVRDLDMWS